MTRTKLMALSAALGLTFSGAARAEEPGTFKVPGTDTTVKVYGYVQLDTTYDFNGRTTNIDGLDWASFVAVQPFNNATPQHQLYMTARTSRFGLTTSTPSSLGLVGTKLEGDFNSPSPDDYSSGLSTNGVTFRLRHAYGTLTGAAGQVLVGQTWSNFMDLDAFPDTVDFNVVGAVTELRQPQIRYTYASGPSTVSVAVENSWSRLFGGTATGFAGIPGAGNGDGTDLYSLVPDLTARYSYGGGWGHVSAQGVLLSYHDFVHSYDKVGYGGGLSGDFKFFGDQLVWGAQGGVGMGRYIFNTFLQSGVDDGTGIRLWDSLSYWAGFTHVWSPAFRSNVIVSQTFIKPDEDAAGGVPLAAFVRGAPNSGVRGSAIDPNKRLDEVAVNSFYTLTKNVEVGVEYHYGKRVTFYEGDEGMQHRLNGTFHVNFF